MTTLTTAFFILFLICVFILLTPMLWLIFLPIRLCIWMIKLIFDIGNLIIRYIYMKSINRNVKEIQERGLIKDYEEMLK